MKSIVRKQLNRMLQRHVHKQALAWLARLQAPDLSAAEEQAFTVWLQSHPSHQRAYIEAEALWQNEGAAAAQAAKHASQAKSNKWQWPALWLASPLITACVLAVIIILRPAAPELYFTPEGERQSFTLADGSQLVLQPNSRISVALSKHKRALELQQGEVFFDVAKDAARPFIIQTPSGKVTVLGTQFSVSLATPSPQVTVLEGRVAVAPINTQAVELTANQQLDFQHAAAGKPPLNVNAKDSLAWRQTRFIFKGEPLAEVTQTLADYFGRAITLADPQLEQQTVMAVIQLENFEQALATLSQSLSLKLNYQSDGSAVLTSASLPVPKNRAQTK